MNHFNHPLLGGILQIFKSSGKKVLHNIKKKFHYHTKELKNKESLQKF